MNRKIILATRGSELALAQAHEAAAALMEAEASLAVDIKVINTKGDKDRTSALTKIGGDGLFVRGIEQALLAGEADIAVHCGKDLPCRIADDLVIASVMKAASPADVLISRIPLTELAGAPSPVIGTGSPRRRTEMGRIYPRAQFEECRGNITTRIEKLRDGQFDAIVLAKAGLERLPVSLEGLEVREFDTEEFMPAACQGILAVECRKDDPETRELLKKIEDADSRIRFDAERAMLSALNADCKIPAGAHAQILGTENGAGPETEGGVRLSIRAMYDGCYAAAQGSSDEIEKMCASLAEVLCPM